MILSDTHIDFNIEKFNPSITLHESQKKKDYSFPDPNSYYILSGAGKNYKVMENSTILLNLQKGYYDNYFSISEDNNLVLKISDQLFFGSKPIEGIAKEALELAILKSGRIAPTLKNRL